MDFPLKVPFFQEGESVLYLVTSISFQFIDLVTHQTSTLGHSQVGNARSRSTNVSTQERYCHSGLEVSITLTGLYP